jgi:hypothetical protein
MHFPLKKPFPHAFYQLNFNRFRIQNLGGRTVPVAAASQIVFSKEQAVYN